MPRVVSFIVLAAVLLIIGSVFFQVVLQFAVPLFLAGVLVVVFEPLHKWTCGKIPGRPRTGALATTMMILLLVLIPSLWLAWNGYLELMSVVHAMGEDKVDNDLFERIIDQAAPALRWYEQMTGVRLDPRDLLEHSTGNLGQLLVRMAKAVAGMAIGLAIMMLSVYYFFVDGPMMLETVMKLSPLENRYEHELLDRFSNVSRAVVLASMLSAVAQGLLAGAGYFVAFATETEPQAQVVAQGDAPTRDAVPWADPPQGEREALPDRDAQPVDEPKSPEHRAPVMLLTLLTMVLAIVPFVGCAVVWVPTCLWLWLIDDRALAAGILAAFCATVVANVDNLIKPLVLHGQSNLHPLLALISVLGGVQVLGPVGILVGPMLVAFVQALLTMVNREINDWDAGGDGKAGLLEAAQAIAGGESSDQAPGCEAVGGGTASGSATDPEGGANDAAGQKPSGKKRRQRKRR